MSETPRSYGHPGITDPVDERPSGAGSFRIPSDLTKHSDADLAKITGGDLTTIDAADLLASRVFGREAAMQSALSEEMESNFD
jgi:hypothetical protein